LLAIDTLVEQGESHVPVTHQDPPDEEDGQVILQEDSEESPSTLKMAGCSYRSRGIRQNDGLHHRLKVKRNELKKPTSREAHQHQHIPSVSSLISCVVQKD